MLRLPDEKSRAENSWRRPKKPTKIIKNVPQTTAGPGIDIQAAALAAEDQTQILKHHTF